MLIGVAKPLNGKRSHFIRLLRFRLQGTLYCCSRPVDAIRLAYQALRLKTKDCYTLVAPPQGQFGSICLTYHASGGCYEACGRRLSHKLLSTADQASLLTYCSQVAAAKEASA
jgi:hypothetical protein